MSGTGMTVRHDGGTQDRILHAQGRPVVGPAAELGQKLGIPERAGAALGIVLQGQQSGEMDCDAVKAL